MKKELSSIWTLWLYSVLFFVALPLVVNMGPLRMISSIALAKTLMAALKEWPPLCGMANDPVWSRTP